MSVSINNHDPILCPHSILSHRTVSGVILRSHWGSNLISVTGGVEPLWRSDRRERNQKGLTPRRSRFNQSRYATSDGSCWQRFTTPSIPVPRGSVPTP